jgi:hypothetical protein
MWRALSRFLPDRPADASFLTPEEKVQIHDALAAEAAAKPHGGQLSLFKSLSHPRILHLTAIHFLFLTSRAFGRLSRSRPSRPAIQALPAANPGVGSGVTRRPDELAMHLRLARRANRELWCAGEPTFGAAARKLTRSTKMETS